MKILYHHRIASRDGMDVHITELTRAFRQLGHELEIVSPQMHQRAEFGKGGELTSAIRENLPKSIGEILEMGYDRYAYRRLEQAYLRFKPDVLYERANLFLGAGLRLKQKYALPFLLEVNAPLYLERAKYGGLSLKAIAQAQERKVWCGADRVFPVTDVLAETLISNGVQPDRIDVLPNGIDTSVFHPDVDGSPVRQRYAIPADDIVLGFTGFVRDWHRIDLLLNLAASLRDTYPIHVLIVGDGPAAAELKALAQQLDLVNRTHFTGVISREQMAAHVAAFNIAFQPSATPYASPLKLVEYIGMAKPVVAPKLPNIEQTVGEAGVMHYFSADEPETIMSAVSAALNSLSSDSELARERAKNVRTWLMNAEHVTEVGQALLAA